MAPWVEFADIIIVSGIKERGCKVPSGKHELARRPAILIMAAFLLFTYGTVSSPAQPAGFLGAWYRGGPASIYQQGDQTFCRNEKGDVSRCRIESTNQIRALDWAGGLVGTLSADGQTLSWANNSQWTRQSGASASLFLGAWYRGTAAASVYEQGGQLFCRNERGDVTRCRMESPTQIRALDWAGGLVGTLSTDYQTINWANNSQWSRQSGLSAAPFLGTWYRGAPALIYEQGGQLYCRNEKNQISRCRVESATRIRALDWVGGLAATLSTDGGTLNWDNNSQWYRKPTGGPPPSTPPPGTPPPTTPPPSTPPPSTPPPSTPPPSTPPPSGGLRNLALHRPAQQSSDFSPATGASLGVDGNLTTLFHTQEDRNPWWQVDLGAIYTLSTAKIYNRQDCCLERSRLIQVMLSNDGSNWQTVYAHNGIPFGQNQLPLQVNLESRRARYVRLQNNESGYLHLLEVEIYGQ
jgi:hypothetical protein